MANQAKRLLTNSIYNLSTFVNQVLLGVLLVPFVVRHLGDTAYGVWALISAVLSYSTLLTLSLNSGVNRWIPILLVRDDADGVNRVASTAHFAFAVSGAVVALAIALLSYGFPVLFAVPGELASDARLATALVGVGFFFVVQLNVFGGVLTGLERYDMFAASEVSRAVVQIVGVAVVLLSDGGLVDLAVVYGLANVARAGLAWLLARRALPDLELRWRHASWSLFREMLGYSVNTFLYRVHEVLARQMGLILIGAMLTAAAVTEFALPTTLVGVVMTLIAQTTNVMKPAVSRLDAGGEDGAVRTLFITGSKLALLVALPMGLVLALYGDRVLELWLQDAYLPGSAPILSVMALAAVFRAWLRPGFFVLVGLGRHRVFGRVAIAQVVLGTVFAYVGLRAFDFGTVGVAWAFALPEIVAAVVLLAPYTAASVGVPWTALLRATVLPALLGTLPVALVLVGFEAQLRSFEGFAFVAVLAAVGTLAPIGAWLLGLTANEKRMLLSVTRRS